MSDMKLKRARKIYGQVCAELDRRDWKYDKYEDKLIVSFKVSGDDLPIHYLIVVDVERQLIRLISPLPVEMGEDKRMEGCIAATHVISCSIVDGTFDFDLTSGKVAYRLVQTFRDCDDVSQTIAYMIDLTGFVVDQYNDKFFALNKGILSLKEFMKKD